ncbi:PREDICTED: coiled-coil domain-containing protein AGAP005037-like [Rhagoletis zephyria]|uniref:coiled-coil domain-containing protein AGAP005037-like n=1 Tax=Rhagoletis zephyria TaxID=28612 RepID=UPI00081172F4|nr:PREDICTED: coiled-coil domain-containing protein AGAP005037-like [Rhagoletis zephyria]
MGKKSTNNSTSSSGTGLFGTLRNSFRRRSSSSFSGKLNSSGSSAVSPKREPTSEAFPIVNQSQNGKVQKESNYSGSIKKNGVNNTDRVPENPLEINYRNSDVTAALKTTKLASNQTPETDCKESNLSEIKTEQPGESGKKEQTPLTGEAEVYSALPETAANNTDLKKMKTEDVSTDAEMFRFLSSGIYSNLALLSAMSRQSRNNRSSQKQPAGKQSDNVSSNQPDSAPSRPSKGVSQQQQQQQQQFASIGAAVPHRPSSTTPLDRNFYAMQSNQASLFDDDPGIMSEIETSATGFRRGNKVRSSLPIVRTPSKSQDRSLGLVFLQFRSETKRALLPNEITSIDTVKALFVRSFPRQLTMEYLDHPSVRIYIHDASKDMFYELEDLRDVKDRVILRIYEQGVNGPQPGGGGLPIAFQNQSVPPEPGENYGYFSEPEFDSEFQSQHVHRKRFPPPPPPMQVNQPQPHMLVGPNGPMGQSQYYGTIMLPPQYRSATLGIRPGFISSGTLPGQPPPQPPTRNKAYPGIPAGNQQTPPKPTRSFVPSPGPPPPQAAGLIVIQGHHPRPPPALPPGSMAPSSASVHQHLAQQYHQSRPLPDRPYSVAGHYPSPDRMGARPIPYPAGANPADFSGYLSSPEHRPSAAMMALHAGQAQARSSFSGYPNSRPFDAEMAAGMAAAAAAAAAGVYPHPAAVYASRPPPPPGVAPIDEEARVRMQEMERQIASLTNVVSKALGSSKPGSKPPPPPKPPSLISGYRSDISSTLNSDSATQLKQIRRRARDLRNEVRALKRFALQQTNTTRESLKETCNKIKSTLSFLSSTSDIQLRMERLVVSTDRDSYNDDVIRLDKDLLDLETNVEELRSNVINRRCRVNMSNVESMALTLSRASKTVADLKTRYPVLAQHLKTIMAKELQQIEREEKFLKEEPERLEHSLKRCKKLTGTLVTLKRLASVQEQRSSNNPNTCSPSQLLQAVEKKEISMDEGFVGTAGSDGLMSRSYDADLMEPHTVIHVTPATPSSTDSSKTSATASNMLENLLDELQTFSKQSSMDSPSSSTAIPAGSHQRSSLRGALNSNAKQALLLNQSDTVVRKGDHSCSSTANQTASPSISTSSSTSSSSNLPVCSPPPDNSSCVNDVNEHDGNECRSVVEDSSAAAPECIPNEQHIRSTGQQIEQQQPPQSEPLQSAL